jgi:hypothetical protein
MDFGALCEAILDRATLGAGMGTSAKPSESSQATDSDAKSPRATC